MTTIITADDIDRLMQAENSCENLAAAINHIIEVRLRPEHLLAARLSPQDAPLSEGMTKAEYMKFHEATCLKMVEITKAKNSDYCGIGDDPFHNFRSVEKLGICSVEQGFLTRMTDKLARINSFVQKGSLQVKDESVADTLMDLANYSILMAGFLKAKRKN